MEDDHQIEVMQGSENVFADLGFSPEEAINLKIRADLMLNLKSYIQTQGWTRAETAAFFGEPQPHISDLLNGDIDRFSIDQLIVMLTKAGMQIKIEVTSQAA